MKILQPSNYLLNPCRPADLYHTCYCLSGLSVSQHCKFTMEPRVVGNMGNEVIPTHPIYNVPPKAVLKAQAFFGNNSSIPEDRSTRAGTQDTDRDVDEVEDEARSVKSEPTTTTVSDIWTGRED